MVLKIDTDIEYRKIKDKIKKIGDYMHEKEAEKIDPKDKVGLETHNKIIQNCKDSMLNQLEIILYITDLVNEAKKSKHSKFGDRCVYSTETH